MKKWISTALIAAMLLALPACGSYTPLPNPPLVLGEKYLFDLDYEQAILQFDQAIKIDPKNPRPWVGKLIVDVLNPVDPDNPSVPKYPDMPRLPDFPDIPDDPTPRVFFPPIIEWYRQHGWTDLVDKLLELLGRVFPGEEWGEGVGEPPAVTTTPAPTTVPQPEIKPKRGTLYLVNGDQLWYTTYEYDDKGNAIREEIHSISNISFTQGEIDFAEGDVRYVTSEHTYDSNGLLIQTIRPNWQRPSIYNTSTYEYNAQGQQIRRETLSSDGSSSVSTYEYNAQGQLIRQENGDSSYSTFEYDANGLRIRTNLYNEAGELYNYTLYEY